jgi:hypothetical protein
MNEYQIAKAGLEEIAKSVSALATAVDKLDLTPTPTKSQFVREAALRMTCARLQSGGAMHAPAREQIVTESVDMAKELWLKSVGV